uniref:Cytochrome c oxidase subunit 2 n=1 Tax=Megaris sp. TaxID=2931300 RepID=A0A8T9ZWN6_9HEMI|nr:cytochrome c oxidase subunit II [Megaris sp.]
MYTWKELMTQNANSPLMEQLIMFHDHTLMILMMITMIITYMMISLFTNKFINRMLMENQFIELIWTIIPAIMLLFIALPSLKLLYLIDEINKPLITIKIIGHQWYWSYEYSDFQGIEFDSYMKPLNEMHEGEFRLLEVDNRLILPINSSIRVLITAADVLHSWTIPQLGVKMDAIPGRLNQSTLNIYRPGIMYGQCSEICGTNHSFMPIMIESTIMKFFMSWIKSY